MRVIINRAVKIWAYNFRPKKGEETVGFARKTVAAMKILPIFLFFFLQLNFVNNNFVLVERRRTLIGARNRFGRHGMKIGIERIETLPRREEEESVLPWWFGW